MEAARRCEALALLRVDAGERFDDDLLDIGVSERERMPPREAHRCRVRCSTRPAKACRSTWRSFGIERFDLNRPMARRIPRNGSTLRAHAGRGSRRDRRGAGRRYPARAALSGTASVRARRMGDLLRPRRDDRRGHWPSCQSRLVLIHGIRVPASRRWCAPAFCRSSRSSTGATTRPGSPAPCGPRADPLESRRRIRRGSRARGDDLERIGDIAGRFNARSATLASVAASLEGVQGKSLCVLVDQFEELFRFEKETGRDEAELFVDLIGAPRHETRRKPPGRRRPTCDRHHALGIPRRMRALRRLRRDDQPHPISRPAHGRRRALRAVDGRRRRTAASSMRPSPNGSSPRFAGARTNCRCCSMAWC